jgi:hypothetical protein
MDNELENIIQGNEKLKITCVERKYKISGSRVTYIITAKKELNEDVTGKLLFEDMELKTFLANYEISKVIPKDIEVSEEKATIEKKIIDNEKIQVIAKLPSLFNRDYVIMMDMGDEFCLQDIADFYLKSGENYDIRKLKNLLSKTLKHLRTQKMIEIVNPNDNNRNKRYHKLIKDKDEIEKRLQNIKEGKNSFNVYKKPLQAIQYKTK